jgi:hypothetical protein
LTARKTIPEATKNSSIPSADIVKRISAELANQADSALTPVIPKRSLVPYSGLGGGAQHAAGGRALPPPAERG